MDTPQMETWKAMIDLVGNYIERNYNKKPRIVNIDQTPDPHDNFTMYKKTVEVLIKLKAERESDVALAIVTTSYRDLELIRYPMLDVEIRVEILGNVKVTGDNENVAKIFGSK
jgi:hypothetical protein